MSCSLTNTAKILSIIFISFLIIICFLYQNVITWYFPIFRALIYYIRFYVLFTIPIIGYNKLIRSSDDMHLHFKFELNCIKLTIILWRIFLISLLFLLFVYIAINCPTQHKFEEFSYIYECFFL